MRGDLIVSTDDVGSATITTAHDAVALTAGDLRWIVVAAGPALLVDLGRRETPCP